MKDWTKYDKQTIWNDKKKGGLLVSFLSEYKQEFNLNTINASCGSCFQRYWDNYLNSRPVANQNKKEVQCDFKLHKKYNGIQLGATGRPIRNGEMTNAVAEELLAKHPHGAKLFEIMPDQTQSTKDKEAEAAKKVQDRVKKKAENQKKAEKKRSAKTSKAIKAKASKAKESPVKPTEIEIARAEYQKKFDKPVPNAFKNKLDWINNRIGKS